MFEMVLNKYFSFIVYVLLNVFNNSHGQALITDDNVKFKSGIYKNIEEFKHNSPSYDWNCFSIVEIREKYVHGYPTDSFNI